MDTDRVTKQDQGLIFTHGDLAKGAFVYHQAGPYPGALAAAAPQPKPKAQTPQRSCKGKAAGRAGGDAAAAA